MVTISFTGSSGVVTSVQGTSPVQVNGVSGSPETGAVVVSVTGSVPLTFQADTGTAAASSNTIIFAGNAS